MRCDDLEDRLNPAPPGLGDHLAHGAPADLDTLALSSLVSRAAEAGDPAALEIASEAAERLVATLRRVHESGPVVLAGSVLTSEGPVRQAVMELLAGEHVTTAGAAAWLAARDILQETDAKARHAAFTAAP
ncbi:hypothetical protein [Nonomuraea sp. NPDC050786]|uniref:hypothetical protein n=1 Tax=Nonomuraea sp. NPDC050786 TaxID=3154840 RepID=UPI0034017617